MNTQIVEYDSRTGSSGGKRTEVYFRVVQRPISDAMRKFPIATTTSTSGEIVLMVFNAFNDEASQAWFWTPEWQAGEAEADAQLAAGQADFYESGEDLARAFRERRSRNGNV